MPIGPLQVVSIRTDSRHYKVCPLSMGGGTLGENHCLEWPAAHAVFHRELRFRTHDTRALWIRRSRTGQLWNPSLFSTRRCLKPSEHTCSCRGTQHSSTVCVSEHASLFPPKRHNWIIQMAKHVSPPSSVSEGFNPKTPTLQSILPPFFFSKIPIPS